MSEDKATPRPWKLNDYKVPTYERVLSVVTEDNLAICRIDGAGSRNPKVIAAVEANAALIVQAVNSHDALVAALKEARVWLDDSNGNEDLTAAIKQVDAVLTTAKQGTEK